MPRAQQHPDDFDDTDDRAEALERASDYLMEAREAADRAGASSLRLFVNMALLEAGGLLARLQSRWRSGH